MFHLEDADSCRFDSLSVYDSYLQLMGTFCGLKGPRFIKSSGNTMFVIFKTDSTVTKEGFMCGYMAGEANYYWHVKSIYLSIKLTLNSVITTN